MVRKEKRKNALKSIYSPFILLIILVPIGLLVSLLTDDPLIPGVYELAQGTLAMILNIVSFKLPLFSLFCLVVGSLFYLIVLKSLNSNIPRSGLISKSEGLPAFSDKWSEIVKLKKEIAELKKDSWYTTNLQFLHENYRDLESIEQMYLIVEEGRGVTLGEVLNRLLDQRDREKLERSSPQSLSKLQEESMVEAAALFYRATAILYGESPFYQEWVEELAS